MKPGRIIPQGMAGLLLGLAAMMPLAAQSRLYVLEPDGKYHPVVKVDETRPCIMEQGRSVPAKGDRFALRKVEEYLPLYIEVHDQTAGTTFMTPIARGEFGTIEINHEFHYSAKFASPYPLEDVFMLLELVGADVDKPYFFVHEIGRLESWNPKAVTVDMNLQQKLGSGRFRLHVFAAGSEVFTTETDAAEREAALDRMVAKRIAAVQEANPSPFYGFTPPYPPALRSSRARGQVVLALRLSARGAVLDAVVESATDPAFGEAALAVARQWRFLPGVENGHAIESRVKMPLVFDPP